MIRQFAFWIYRPRQDAEDDGQSADAASREYQRLRFSIQQKWPGLRFRIAPAPGRGVKLKVIPDLGVSMQSTRRFVASCLQDRNEAEPTARLKLGE